jgi:hypothetical protein
MVGMASMISEASAPCGQPVVTHMLQSDSRRSDAGALCVGALPQVVAAADIVGRGGRRLAGLPAVAALAGVAPGSSARSLASVL